MKAAQYITGHYSAVNTLHRFGTLQDITGILEHCMLGRMRKGNTSRVRCVTGVWRELFHTGGGYQRSPGRGSPPRLPGRRPSDTWWIGLHDSVYVGGTLFGSRHLQSNRTDIYGHGLRDGLSQVETRERSGTRGGN